MVEFGDEKSRLDTIKINWMRVHSKMFFRRRGQRPLPLLLRRLYPPFCKLHVYFSTELNEVVSQIPKLFSTLETFDFPPPPLGGGGS